MKKITTPFVPQSRLQSYYRNALALAGIGADQSMHRDWFIKHRATPVEKGPFTLAVTKVPTMSVNLKRLRTRIQKMDPALSKKFRKALSGCTVRGTTFRVEVKPCRT